MEEESPITKEELAPAESIDLNESNLQSEEITSSPVLDEEPVSSTSEKLESDDDSKFAVPESPKSPKNFDSSNLEEQSSTEVGGKTASDVSKPEEDAEQSSTSPSTKEDKSHESETTQKDEENSEQPGDSSGKPSSVEDADVTTELNKNIDDEKDSTVESTGNNTTSSSETPNTPERKTGETSADKSSSSAPTEATNTEESLPSTPVKAADNSHVSATPELLGSEESTSESPAASISSRRETNPKLSYIMLDVNHKKVEPKDIIEYEWPIKSGDRWFLQEQIGELLGIKSFSRKYPNLCRRKVNSEEREFLERVHGVHKLLNETSLRDMNAMRASEIHDMMQNDFPDVCLEYKKVVSQREKEIQLEKAKEMNAIKNDAAKYEELREQSKKSVRDFNRDLSQMRKQRKGFFDIQTNIIQSPRNRWMVMKPEATKPGLYPVSLIPGQYQTYYKEYTPEELRRLPLGTVTDSDYLFPPVREASPPPLIIAEQDLIRAKREEEMKALQETIRDSSTTADKEPLAKRAKVEKGPNCYACDIAGGNMICCAECEIVYHPECIEMPDRMVRVVKSYEWNCIECRTCSICHKKDNEDSIVSCDWCDRAFHYLCAGLRAMPRGMWMCQVYCSPSQNRTPTKKAIAGTSGSKR
ncbi:hypothetical protein CAEBREN_23443 [Caenorhabditis brenneri]|uniref:PHD finger protein 10 n=1 Tax=Caenorhabditis brenneri TaxID=135651 RepID=G0MHA5_CAEBE|nr:hypothetical protein CAEBREN_23443 [Caenorhabditis brenneri]